MRWVNHNSSVILSTSDKAIELWKVQRFPCALPRFPGALADQLCEIVLRETP